MVREAAAVAGMQISSRKDSSSSPDRNRRMVFPFFLRGQLRSVAEPHRISLFNYNAIVQDFATRNHTHQRFNKVSRFNVLPAVPFMPDTYSSNDILFRVITPLFRISQREIILGRISVGGPLKKLEQ